MKVLFRFNPNQADYDERRVRDAPWREDLEAFAGDARGAIAYSNLGSPLLCRDEALAFLRRARELAPSCHLRLYTSGAGLDEAFCEEAVATDWMRFASASNWMKGRRLFANRSTAFDWRVGSSPTSWWRCPLLRTRCARRGIALRQLAIGAERPSTCEDVRRVLAVEVPGCEVLTSGFPAACRSTPCVSGPPCVAGSSVDEGLRLGVHYCSLDNKNRDQVLQQESHGAIGSCVVRVGRRLLIPHRYTVTDWTSGMAGAYQGMVYWPTPMNSAWLWAWSAWALCFCCWVLSSCRSGRSIKPADENVSGGGAPSLRPFLTDEVKPWPKNCS